MTRGMFTGSRMTGTIGSGTKKRTAKDMYIARHKGQASFENMSDDERYKQIFEDKLEDLRKRAKTGVRFSVAPPGTDMVGVRELSESAQKAIDDIIHKRAKKYAKERSRTVKIVPKQFTGIQGGRLDARGAIYGPDGRWVATVDKKTGKVRSRRGLVVCKYNPNSSVCEFRIANFIANEYRTRRGNLYAARGHSNVAYGIYGQAGVHDDDVYGNHGDHGFLSPLHGNSEGVWGTAGNDHSLWGSGGVHGGGGGIHGGGGDIWGHHDKKGGSVWG